MKGVAKRDLMLIFPLLIGNRNDMYKQIFEIESNGTSSIRKFEYKLSRSRWLGNGAVEKE
jgi:hypothetical protein